MSPINPISPIHPIHPVNPISPINPQVCVLGILLCEVFHLDAVTMGKGDFGFFRYGYKYLN